MEHLADSTATIARVIWFRAPKFEFFTPNYHEVIKASRFETQSYERVSDDDPSQKETV